MITKAKFDVIIKREASYVCSYVVRVLRALVQCNHSCCQCASIAFDSVYISDHLIANHCYKLRDARRSLFACDIREHQQHQSVCLSVRLCSFLRRLLHS